ncbi:MAG: HAD family hydrolase [Actinomycetes bacterium]
MSPSPRVGSTRPEGVLLDMDGLLVDTEPVWFAVESEVAARLGGPWTPEHQQALLGSSLPAAAGYMLEISGAGVATETVQGWLLDGMAQRLRDGPPALLPGAADLLAGIGAADLPCALVSSSYRVLMDTVVAGLRASLGALPFHITVAGDEVTHRKPHPEPYLAAAAALGADPARCVVLEDSPTGVASAEAAGCAVVVVPSLVPVGPGPRRDVLVSLRDLDWADVGVLLAS